jgi:prolipoprotein diacylglyceryltransferase
VSDSTQWFAPKRYGYGAGLPVRWQGWALIIGFVAALVAIAFTLRHHLIQLIAALVPITLAFVVIAARTTRGGWRWRCGEED